MMKTTMAILLALLLGSSDIASAGWQPRYEPRPYYGNPYYGNSYYEYNRIYRPYGPHSPTNLSNRDAVKRAVIRYNGGRYHHRHYYR